MTVRPTRRQDSLTAVSLATLPQPSPTPTSFTAPWDDAPPATTTPTSPRGGAIGVGNSRNYGEHGSYLPDRVGAPILLEDLQVIGRVRPLSVSSIAPAIDRTALVSTHTAPCPLRIGPTLLFANVEVTVRVSAIKVTNFKAVRHAELSELHAQPFTVLTGQNGTGKSAILEALYLVTRGLSPEPQPDLVRLGEVEAEIEVSFSVSDCQFEQVDRYYRSVYGKPAEPKEQYRRVAKINKAENVTYSGSQVAAAIFDPTFRRGRSFPGVTLVHAERGRMPGLDIGDANAPKPGGQFGSFAPADYLTSCLTALDYRSLLEARQGGCPRDDYGDLARVFYEATGKLLLRPRGRASKEAASRLSCATTNAMASAAWPAASPVYSGCCARSFARPPMAAYCCSMSRNCTCTRSCKQRYSGRFGRLPPELRRSS
jgi:AAA domain